MIDWSDGVYRRFSRRGLSCERDPDVVIYTSEKGDILFYEVHARLKRDGVFTPLLSELMAMEGMIFTKISTRITIGRRP